MKKWILIICNAIIDFLDEKQSHEIMYGFNLTYWNYLGYTTITWSYYNEEKPYKFCDIMFFEHKKTGKRRAHFSNTKRSDCFNHSFVTVSIPRWECKDIPLRDVIQGYPSKYLEALMMKNYGHAWSSKTKWWVPASEHQKYENAKEKQQEKKEEPKIEVKENIVEVDFTKK